MNQTLQKRRNETRAMVFCAIVCALSFVFSLLGTISGIFDLTTIVFSGLLVGLLLLELGLKRALLVWAVTSVLLFLFLPDKLVAIEYLTFAGIYPVIKLFIEKIHLKIVPWILKFAYFNLVLTALILLATKVQLFMSADNDLELTWIVYLIGNVFFLILDLCLSVYIRVYFLKFRKRLKIAAWLGTLGKYEQNETNDS